MKSGNAREFIKDLNEWISKDRMLYRYEDSLVWDDMDNSRVVVELCKYRITKITECGVRVRTTPFQHGNKGTKFILLTARKQWACVTPELALVSFIARKRRQVGILEAQLSKANLAWVKGLEILNKDK